ncbi:peroxidase 64 [Dorcoceras hygrometricum]|uniref:Peroxidase 64 n=1 Tax=Dorcoceras hygrometricum TaxID=472368 RepID=A0A2Z7C454_9LAMI|nr:peroxidase 64 [Dorcoceras hygrometricum]
MKFLGSIEGREVVVMVDSGASHNFVSRKLVTELGLPVDESVKFGVCLGDGGRVPCHGLCKGLIVDLHSCVVEVDSYAFQLGGVDLILGVDWLRTLGEVVTNWELMHMSFSIGKETVTLMGEPRLSRAVSSLKSMLKITDMEFCGAIWFTGNGGMETERREEATQPTTDLEELLKQYKELFDVPRTLPPTRTQDHAIRLKEGHGPVQVRPYRYAHHQKDEIEKMVSEMMQSGIIQPSCSPFSSPVILVKKKDGSWRFCVDYRALNEATITDKFPMPIIDELLDELHGAVWFSKLDMRSGYHQIRVRPEDVCKTAFRTHEGHYEFLVMPFGLKNAPATFQATMNEILKPFLRKCVLVFLDDILIFSTDWETHLKHLREVLDILEQHQLLLHKKKCVFGLRQVEYLGHIISGEGVAMDPGKVAAVEQWPKPTSTKEVRGFLGLTGYYRKFIRDYGKIAKPLTDLLKKDSLGWNDDAQGAFELLKKAISTAPVLRMPDFKQQFVIECDASGRGVGAVLTQDGRPVAYFSKALASRSLSKSTYEKELMALVLAIQHWRPYLLGRKFLVMTDHRSLTSLMKQRVTTPDQQHWMRKLLGFEFEIRHKAGVNNGAADALSRVEGELELQGISGPEWLEIQELNAAVQQDPFLGEVTHKLVTGERNVGSYSLSNGVLLHKGKIVLPRNSVWTAKILLETHATPTGGHSGAFRTLKRAAATFFWKGMKADVAQFVAQCEVCQKHKYETTKPSGFLQPLPIPVAIWEDIALDFIVGLPKSKGFEVIMVVVDRLSKYAHFIPLKHPFTAKGVAEMFSREIAKLHGPPKSIVSDRDPIFMSNFWTEFFRLQGTLLKMSSSYHPQTDGQTEVLNRCLETYLRCFSSEQPRSGRAGCIGQNFGTTLLSTQPQG